MRIRKTIAVMMAAALLLAGVARAEATAPGIETDVAEIQKHGNLVLDLTASGLLAQGYEYGDVITVTVHGQAPDMPVGSNYSDVDSGFPVCRAFRDEANGQDAVVIAVNMGNLTAALGIAEKTAIDEEPGIGGTTSLSNRSPSPS